MENTVEIAPNQLPLFDMLTVEQEIELARVKAGAKRDQERREKEVKDKIDLLYKTGFTTQQYRCSVEWEKATRRFNVAKWKDVPKFVEVEVNEFRGSCNLMYSRFNKETNSITTAITSFTLRNGKIECYSLTGNWRNYKPESILAKVKESYEIAKNQYELYNRKQTVVEYTINKYKQLYPDAKVTAGKDYTSGRYYNEYDKVTVEFKSGSYVSFRLGSENDRELVFEKHDAVFKKLSANEVMDLFNSQQPK